MHHSVHLLGAEEKALIGDIQLLSQAAEAATHMEIEEARRIRRCLFERMRMHLLDLEALTRQQVDAQNAAMR